MARTSSKELAAQAAKEAVKQALRARDEETSGEISSSAEASMNESEEEAIQAGEDDRDVFDLALERINKFNDSVLYEIYKDGVRLGTKSHPYSWDKLQKELGAGLYRIVGRSVRTKQIFKHSTMPLGDALQESETFAFGESNEVTTPSAGASMSELMMFMNRQDEVRRREAVEAEVIRRQDAKETQQASREFLQTMLTLAAPIVGQLFGRREEPKSIDQAIMEHLRSTTENQNKMIERLQDRVEKSGSGNGQDPMSAFEMMQNMQDRAFSQVKMMEDLAKEKAEEMAGYASGRSGDDDKPKSVFESMMTTMLPAIAKGIVGLSEVQAQSADNETSQATPEPRRAVPRLVSNGGQVSAQTPAAVDARRTQPTPRPQGGTSTRPQSAPGQGADSGRSSETSVVKAPTFLGLPTAVKAPPVSQAPSLAVVLPPEAPAQPQTSEKELTVKSVKDQTLDLLVPYLGQALQSRTPAPHAAQTSITMLERAGVRPDLALKDFTWTEITRIADGYAIPALMRPAVDSWLKTYHTELTQRIMQVAASG